MKISTKGRYGLRIMADIATNSKGECVPLKDIAGRLQLSEKYLEQIIGLLCKAELVKSVRGAKGGYLLSREPMDITVFDILLATEGSLAPVACAEDKDFCAGYCDCVTSFIWERIYDSVTDVCKSITLFDLAQKSKDAPSGKCNSGC